MKNINRFSKWGNEQFKAYAAAFWEGDSVRIGGEWHKVKRDVNISLWQTVGYGVDGEGNHYRLNFLRDSEGYYEGVTEGFLKSCVDSPYEIVTPRDYEVKEGDKLVWLGETQKQGDRSEFTFGKMYEVFMSEDGSLIYKNDMTIMLLASYLKEKSSMWGVIPKWSNVKGKEKTRKDFKFNIGDRVIVVGTSGSYEGFEGFIGQLEEVDGCLSYAVLFNNGRGRWFESSELRLAQKRDKAIEYSGKFHVRSRVQFSQEVFGTGKNVGIQIGAKGIVLEVDESNGLFPYQVYFEESDISVWLNETELELVNLEKASLVKGKEKHHIGDTVHIVTNNSLNKFKGNFAGEKGIVFIADKLFETFVYAVRLDSQDNLVWFKESALESTQKDITETADCTITRDKHTIEQQAIELLIELSEEQTHAMLQDEVKRATKTFLDKNDYKNAKRAIDIIEQLGRK